MYLKYVFKKYSDDYPVLFKREKLKLRKILGNVEIVHIGSTAIIGLGGKGIIDVFVAVKKKEMEKCRLKLEEGRYIFKPFSGTSERDFFYRKYVYGGRERRVHVHLTFQNSIEIRRVVAFVKYINNHSKKVKEYEKVKKEAVKYANGDGEKYREYKKKFLDEISKDALKEFSS